MIEGEEHELIGPPFIHRRLESAEYWHAITVQRAKLAVEIGGLCWQRMQGLDGALIAFA